MVSATTVLSEPTVATFSVGPSADTLIVSGENFGPWPTVYLGGEQLALFSVSPDGTLLTAQLLRRLNPGRTWCRCPGPATTQNASFVVVVGAKGPKGDPGEPGQMGPQEPTASWPGRSARPDRSHGPGRSGRAGRPDGARGSSGSAGSGWPDGVPQVQGDRPEAASTRSCEVPPVRSYGDDGFLAAPLTLTMTSALRRCS